MKEILSLMAFDTFQEELFEEVDKQHFTVLLIHPLILSVNLFNDSAMDPLSFVTFVHRSGLENPHHRQLFHPNKWTTKFLTTHMN